MPAPSDYRASDSPSMASIAAPEGITTEVLDSLIEEIASIPDADPKAQAMPQEEFDTDLIVIGAGHGGYVAAIRAAQLGAKVTVIEREYLGALASIGGASRVKR